MLYVGLLSTCLILLLSASRASQPHFASPMNNHPLAFLTALVRLASTPLATPLSILAHPSLSDIVQTHCLVLSSTYQNDLLFVKPKHDRII